MSTQMNVDVLKVSLRKEAVFIPGSAIGGLNDAKAVQLRPTTSLLLANCVKLGYTFSEKLLRALDRVSPAEQLRLLESLREIKGVYKNWTPLVKQWNIPTGESVEDHIVTWLCNTLKVEAGPKLACGHIIPEGTFPLKRYNGCPFCGTPFEYEIYADTIKVGKSDKEREAEFIEKANIAERTASVIKEVLKIKEDSQASDVRDSEAKADKLTVLELWNEKNMADHFRDLLESPVALDATQIDSLNILIYNFDMPEGVTVRMKETLMLVIENLVYAGKADAAGSLFKAPNDILRYLWFKHTGFLQIVEPRTIVKRLQKNARNFHTQLDASSTAKINAFKDLKLKFDREHCRIYASWLNGLTMDLNAQCESMHPKRGIWVRVIRALRLAEYSQRKGYENLAALLDKFYNEDYEVWQGKVDQYKLKSDSEKTFRLLRQRPGLFARSLFSTMLWFGPDRTLEEFRRVMYAVPARLIFTLYMYAEVYFQKDAYRTVRPLGGTSKLISTNKLSKLYSDKDLARIQQLVKEMALEVIRHQLAKVENTNKTIYIDPGLFNVPVSIGDRGEQIQDESAAAMGTRFPVEGDKVRLFLEWGVGLPSQHLDMDLSCSVIYSNKTEYCSYQKLNIKGCKHSGDIQRIPDMVGTAEYIEIDLKKLESARAKYVSFACNAYTNGALSPNLVVGWMNSKHRMYIGSNGAAYDPAKVQQMIRIRESLTKGMIFGLLDVAKREILWMEMSFGGQIIQDASMETTMSFLKKLDAKLKIGELFEMKAESQGLIVVNEPEAADEVYDMSWAVNAEKTSRLFLG